MTKHGLVNNLLALLIMPTPLEILHLTWLMCSAQLSLLSIVMPKNIVEDTCFIALSLIKFFRLDMFSVGCSKYHVLGLINA